MKKYLFPLCMVLSVAAVAQEEPTSENEKDTTRISLKSKEIIIIDHPVDSTDASPKKKNNYEAHWSGIDMGFTMLMSDRSFGQDFNSTPYWKNDPAKSMTWNLNLLEHKFSLYKHVVGITTGLGFSFTQTAFKDNYVLNSTSDTLFAVMDTVNNYSKNKLKATYLTVPLMLEFCTNADEDRSFYLAAGVVAGVRIGSKVKRIADVDGDKQKYVNKATYGLQPFKLDAAMRMGYGDWGVFANYNLISMFEKDKTVAVYPLTFGLSLNF